LLEGLGFRVCVGLGFRVLVFFLESVGFFFKGFRVKGLGLWVMGLGFVLV
jgi:hypothetical protein